jgi:hypothetical protein
MNLDRLNRWLTLAANLGVLVGILLLVLELDQNRELTRAQTRSELAMGIVDITSLSASNIQLAGVLRRGDIGEDLTPDEFRQYRARTFALFRYLENVHYQFRQGLYDEVEFMRQRAAWQAYAASSKTGIEIWCRTRSLYSPEFVNDFDSVLTTYTCD